MGTRIYGVVAAQNPDNANETIIMSGLEDRLKFVRDEHDDLTAFRILGSITKSKKIMSEKDCDDDKQRRCWNVVKVPFLYGEAELADDEDHPNAKAAAALLRFTSARNMPLKLGFSVDGGIMQRQTPGGEITEDKEKGKIISRSLAMSAAITAKPCNPKLAGAIFLENDLQKSDYTAEPPAIYWEYLKKSSSSSSFNEVLTPDFVLWMKLESLKKSISDYFGGFTSLKCYTCGSSVRIFKATSDMPNCCSKCNSQYSLTQIWNALNK